MTAIKITQFGGLAPSVDPRNLTGDGAQTALNLDMRFGDFRPSKTPGSPVASVDTGVMSIFQTPSGVWLSSATDTNYVNGQIADAASERVYLTGHAAYPEAWEDGVYRRLGVPAPATAATITLIPVDEFDQSDATAAQQAATEAILASVHATETDALLGNAPPSSGVTPVAPDPDYSKVVLHLRMNTLVGGEFQDASPQQRETTKEAGVTLVTDNFGPLGVNGTGYGNFTGGAAGGITFPEIRRFAEESDPLWTVDVWVMSGVDLEYASIEARDGHIRELTFITPGGAFQTLLASQYAGLFSTQLRCKRTDGSYAIPANVPTLVSMQNTGSTVELYIAGQKVGQTPSALGLELSIFGRSYWTSTHAWVGKADELRVSFMQRYTADFTPDPHPFSTGAFPTGIWLAHGAVTGLPTDDTNDAAYLVPLTLSGGGYVTTNPADEYLRDGSFNGAQVTYLGGQYWAVGADHYRAAGKAVVEATLSANLAAVDDPASPGTPLLTPAQAASVAADIADLYDPLVNPLLASITDVNLKQADLSSQLATGGTVANVTSKLTLLTGSSTTLEAYFTNIDAPIQVILTAHASDIFGDITSAVVTRLVENRAYIVTYITDWNEESAPSPPSELIEADQNDGVQVVAASPTAGRNIVGWRLYRSSTTNTGAAYQLVEDKTAVNAVLDTDGVFKYFDISNLVYTDYKLQDELQESCPSLTWVEPPEDLLGLVGLPNGIMAGFFGKTLCLCEPFQPYAWPVEYQLTLEYDIVGIGVFGQTAVVLTRGYPYYASGADSASFSTQKIESPQACLTKRTIASADTGVVYASPDGLCIADSTGVNVISQGAFSRADWQAEITADSFGAYHDGCYYLFTG